MNVILASVLLCVIGATPDEEYLGRLAYRAQTQQNFSYGKAKKEFFKLSEVDRNAMIYADRMLGQQRQAMYRGGTPQMRIDQTAPAAPAPKVVYPQPWQYYQAYPPYQQFNRYPNNMYYNVLIH